MSSAGPRLYLFSSGWIGPIFSALAGEMLVNTFLKRMLSKMNTINDNEKINVFTKQNKALRNFATIGLALH